MSKRIVIGPASHSVNTRSLTIEYESVIPDSLELFILLEKLRVCMCHGLIALPRIGQLSALTTLVIGYCDVLEQLPESLGCTIQSMSLHNCPALKQLPKSLGQLSSSLSVLSIRSCHALTQLPESIGLLQALRQLEIHWCSRLTKLPASMGQLENLPFVGISWPCDIRFPKAEFLKPSRMDSFRMVCQRRYRPGQIFMLIVCAKRQKSDGLSGELWSALLHFIS